MEKTTVNNIYLIVSMQRRFISHYFIYYWFIVRRLSKKIYRCRNIYITKLAPVLSYSRASRVL